MDQLGIILTRDFEISSVHFISAGIVFCDMFLRGIQHKNVIHHNVLSAGAMSGIINLMSGSSLLLIAVTKDMSVVFANAIAASLGMSLSLITYAYIAEKRNGNQPAKPIQHQCKCG